MKNYIIKQPNGTISVSISQKTDNRLKQYRPAGCPFIGYTMFDLLKDWIQMYAWQITQQRIPIVDFITNINGDGKIAVYGDAMITLLTQ